MDKNSLIQSIIVFFVSITSLIYFISTSNYEFILYVFVLVAFVYFVIYSNKWFEYPKVAIWGLMAWAVIHMAGGAFYIKGVRLYDIILYPLVGEPYNILRVDQFMHFYIYLIIGILIYSIFKKYLKKENKLTTILATFAVLGIGAFYEIIEFSTVVMFTATGVGGYYNNSLDLFFNFLGAIMGILIGKRMKR